MDQTARDLFVRQPQTAVIATVGKNGRIHAVPIWYLYEDGSFLILTERGSVKHRNAVRGGRATICIDERDGGFRHVTAEGPVTVNDPVTFEERLRLHTHYRGAERAQTIVAAGGHGRMVQLVLRAERWIG